MRPNVVSEHISIRYVDNDGINVAYGVAGEGDIDDLCRAAP